MADQSEGDRLTEQAERIRRAEENSGLKPVSSEENRQGGMRSGYHAGIDFLSTVLLTVGLGWIVDQIFGIAPWGLVVLVLVGFGVGFFNLWRAVGKPNNDSGDKA